MCRSRKLFVYFLVGNVTEDNIVLFIFFSNELPMSNYCAVYGCYSDRKKNDCKNIRCRVLNLKNAQICSRHFREEDYEDGIKAKILGFLPKRLKHLAMPSVNLPGSKLILQ